MSMWPKVKGYFLSFLLLLSPNLKNAHVQEHGKQVKFLYNHKEDILHFLKTIPGKKSLIWCFFIRRLLYMTRCHELKWEALMLDRKLRKCFWLIWSFSISFREIFILMVIVNGKIYRINMLINCIVLFLFISMQETVERYLRHTKDTRTKQQPTEKHTQVMTPLSFFNFLWR